MNDIAVHILLFLWISAAIVLLGVMFSEADDSAALKLFPRRFVAFIAGCGILTAILLICEHTVARVS